MVGKALLVGVGRIQDQLADRPIPAEIGLFLEELGGVGGTSREDASAGRALTKTRLSCRMRTFSSGVSSDFRRWVSSRSLLKSAIGEGNEMSSHFKQGRTLLTVETTLRRHRLTYINNYNHTRLFLSKERLRGFFGGKWITLVSGVDLGFIGMICWNIMEFRMGKERADESYLGGWGGWCPCGICFDGGKGEDYFSELDGLDLNF